MSFSLKKIIGGLTGANKAKAAERDQQAIINELERKIGVSSKQLRDVLSNITDKAEFQLGSDKDALDAVEAALSQFIGVQPSRVKKENQGIIDDLRTDITSAFVGGSIPMTPQIEKLLSTRENDVRAALEKSQSSEQRFFGDQDSAYWASKGITPDSASFRASVADKFAGQAGKRFDVENMLSNERFQTNLDEVMGRRQALLGLGQRRSDMTREDVIAQRQNELNNFLAQRQWGQQQYNTSRDIRNNLTYNAPLDLEKYLGELSLTPQLQRIDANKSAVDYTRKRQNDMEDFLQGTALIGATGGFSGAKKPTIAG